MAGTIVKVSGPLVVAENMQDANMFDVVKVGREGLVGEIVEINVILQDKPETVNESPYDNGWMIKIKLSNVSEIEELLSAKSYKEVIEKEEK